MSLRPDHYDDKEKRLSLAFVSEEPVRRDFGYEVIDQEKMDEKAVDGWFQFDYVLDLAKGTETQYIVIG